MKSTLLLALACFAVTISAGQTTYRKAIFLHHSVGDVIYHGSYENTPVPTTVPIEIGKYNTAHGFTGSNVVSMDEPSTRLWPAGGPYGTSENDWWYWQQILSGQDNNSPTFASFLGSYPVIIIKTCYLSEEWMATDDSIAVYKSHYRAIIAMLAQHPDHFFVIWNNYPAYYTGAANSLRSLLFSKWAKDTLATGMDSFGPLPRNVYVFDVFRKIADPVTGIEPLQDIIGGGDEHPSNAAVGVVTPQFVEETFDAALAFEASTELIVTTLPAGNITTTGAQLNGTVNPNGFQANYHFEYGTTNGYGTSTATTSAGSGLTAVPVSAQISGLVPGTLYHFRLAATNSGGTIYGGDTSFTTAAIPPAAATLSAGSITSTGAQLTGSVNPNGLATDNHFEYGLSSGYGSSTATVSAGSGIVPVAVNALLAGLTPGTQYHYRIVATNGAGTTNGNDSLFQTSIPPPSVLTGTTGNITTTSALVNGSANPNGFSTTCHFEYGLTSSYGSSASPVGIGPGFTSVPVSSPLSGLAPGTPYHYRLVAVNAGGTTYGADSLFTSAVPPPSAVTLSASAISITGAQLAGSVTPNGFSTSYHFEYGLTGAYGSSSSTVSAGAGSAPVAASVTLSGLTPGTQYHYRLVASNAGGTVDGFDSTFATTIIPPTVVTLQAGSITATGAQVNGSVDPDGLSTDYHFEYGLTNAYGTSSSTVNAGSGISAVGVNAQLTGLSPGTTYHYRLVATSTAGTAVGSDSSFVTSALPPTAVTLSTSNITTAGAQINGSVNPNGFNTSYHFEYGLNTSYGLSTTTVGAGSGVSSIGVNATLSGLTPGTPFHYRLVASNSGGTVYGFDSTFTTAIPPPTVATLQSGSITTTGAQINGSVNPNGFSTTYHFEYGTTSSYGSVTTASSAGSGVSAIAVSAQIAGLTPGTQYHFRLVASNGGGTIFGNDSLFSTTILPPAVLTLPAGSITTSGAQVAGSVNPNGLSTDYHFEYGLSTGYGSSTTAVNAGSGINPVAVGAPLTGLAPGTQYHYRVVATNPAGTSVGYDSLFVTAVPMPSAVTLPAGNVSTTTAQINGSVNPNGFATSYHFDYGLTSSYGSSTTVTSAGSGTSPAGVSTQLTGLTPGTPYHYRVVAINAGGTAYGNDSTFVTVIPPPTAVTLSAGNVTISGVQLNGSVNPDGFGTSYHFEYGLSSSYGTSTVTGNAGSGITLVPVNAQITSLTPGTVYHYRVVASNSGGTVNGYDSTFTTAILPPAVLTLQAGSVTTSAAQINGQVNPNGLSTTYHFDYGTSTSYGSSTSTGNAGAGVIGVGVNAQLTGLTPGIAYHYRLVATSAAGTTQGSDSVFVTVIPPPLPVTLSASTITTTGAQVNGTVNPNGFATTCHFDYGTTSSYGSSTTVRSAGSGTNAAGVSGQLSGLTPGTLYHYRLAASNSGGTAYGNDSTFRTAIPSPTVATFSASSITTNGAQANGTVNPNGFATTYHFEYGLTQTYGTSSSTVSAGSGKTAVGVNAQITGLSSGTTYHFRLVAVNSGGTTNGNDTSFATAVTPPSATTLSSSNITTTAAQVSGSVNPNGFSTNYHFDYGPTVGYGSSTTATSAGSGTTGSAVNAHLTGLTPGTTYHYRLVAVNSGGTAYGGDSTFATTNFCAVGVVVFLQGPYVGPFMSTGLNTGGILAAHFGSMAIPALAVDSITIEIRDSVQPAKSTIRRYAPAWLLADGTIRDFLDTTKSYLGFTGVAAGSYYVVVRHRNHLAVMTAAPVSLSAGAPPSPYDFSTGQGKAYGTNPMRAVGSRFAMAGGDGNGDGGVDALDRNTVWRVQNGTNGYFGGDFNLDGGVDALDVNLIWRPNNGSGTQVP